VGPRRPAAEEPARRGACGRGAGCGRARPPRSLWPRNRPRKSLLPKAPRWPEAPAAEEGRPSPAPQSEPKKKRKKKAHPRAACAPPKTRRPHGAERRSGSRSSASRSPEHEPRPAPGSAAASSSSSAMDKTIVVQGRPDHLAPALQEGPSGGAVKFHAHRRNRNAASIGRHIVRIVETAPRCPRPSAGASPKVVEAAKVIQAGIPPQESPTIPAPARSSASAFVGGPSTAAYARVGDNHRRHRPRAATPPRRRQEGRGRAGGRRADERSLSVATTATTIAFDENAAVIIDQARQPRAAPASSGRSRAETAREELHERSSALLRKVL